MSFKADVRTRLEDISKAQAVHTEKLDQNTRVLTDHHVRASQLEARIKPIEAHISLVAGVTKIVIAIVTVGAGVGAIFHYFFNKP